MYTAGTIFNIYSPDLYYQLNLFRGLFRRKKVEPNNFSRKPNRKEPLKDIITHVTIVVLEFVAFTIVNFFIEIFNWAQSLEQYYYGLGRE